MGEKNLLFPPRNGRTTPPFPPKTSKKDTFSLPPPDGRLRPEGHRVPALPSPDRVRAEIPFRTPTAALPLFPPLIKGQEDLPIASDVLPLPSFEADGSTPLLRTQRRSSSRPPFFSSDEGYAALSPARNNRTPFPSKDGWFSDSSLPPSGRRMAELPSVSLLDVPKN